MLLPEQIVLPVFDDMVTAGLTVELVNLTKLLVLCALTKQGVALEVITTFTESLANGVFKIYVVELLPTLTPFNFHW